MSTDGPVYLAPPRWRNRYRNAFIACWLLVIAFVAYVAWSLAPYIGGKLAPERRHWSEDNAAFDAVVAELQTPEGKAKYSDEVYATNVEIAGQHVSINEVEGGFLFYDEAGCGIIDTSGYAYLPRGVDPDAQYNLSQPDYRSLGGPWYTFCASW